MGHAVDHFDFAVAEGSVRPVQKSHSTVGAQQSVLNGEATRPDMLPSAQVFAIEKIAIAELLCGANAVANIKATTPRNCHLFMNSSLNCSYARLLVQLPASIQREVGLTAFCV